MQQQRSPIQSCIAKGLAPASCARGWGRREWLLAAALIVLILITFYPVWRCGFVNYDDDVYVTGNPYVQRGLTLRTLGWAWTTSRTANWHPLTWLSLLLDAQLYGPKPWGYHFTNLLLHCANTFLLFALLRRLTGAAARSGVVAALFALHPLHVESVA